MAAPVVTLGKGEKTAECIAIVNGTVSECGPLDLVISKIPEIGQIVDFRPNAVVPGFIDPHHHMFLVACEEFGWQIPGEYPTTIEDVKRYIAGIVASIRPENPLGWVRVQGYRPLSLSERRPLRRHELDSVCPDLPAVVFTSTYHEATVNSLGLECLSITPQTPDPPGGHIGRDRHGSPNGILIEAASFLAEAKSRLSELEPGGAWIGNARAHINRLLRAGITRIGDCAVPPSGITGFLDLEARHRIPINIHCFPVAQGSIAQPLDQAIEHNGSRIHVGHSKILVDGGEHCHLCFTRSQMARAVTNTLISTFTNGPGAIRVSMRGGKMRRGSDGRYHSGLVITPDRTLENLVRNQASAGQQVALHCVGNGACESAISVLSTASFDLEGLKGRPRIEHAFIVDPTMISQMAELEVEVVTQPIFLDGDLGKELTMVKPPEHLKVLPLDDMLASGCRVSISSDYPAAPFEPLVWMKSILRRYSGSRAGRSSGYLDSPDKILPLFTTNAARSLGLEHPAGTLLVGASADFVVLSRNLMSATLDTIDEIQILETWVHGEQVYSSSNSI